MPEEPEAPQITVAPPKSTPREGDVHMFCTDCGTKNTADANFCKSCGHKLDKAVRAPITEEEFAIPPSTDERFSKTFALALERDAQGELNAAADACREALLLRPESTDAHALLSSLYERLGDTEQAIVEREKVLALNPGSIADREKLEALKGAVVSGPPVKINFVRKVPRTAFSDSGVSPAMAGTTFALLVLLIGGLVVMIRGQRPTESVTRPMTTPAPPSVAQQPPAGGTAPQAQPQPERNAQPSASSSAQAAMAAASQGGGAVTPSNGALAGVQPAVVPIPNPPNLEGRPKAPPTTSVPPTDTSAGTVYLPEQGNRNTAAAAPDSGKPAGHMFIRIERPGTGSAGTTGTGSNSDSQRVKQLATQYHQRGEYSRAITEYIKALDGAGDDAGFLHQQIAMCYQRLDQKESAVTQYGEAIKAYDSLVAAGRNVDAAKVGIKACQSGIRACQ